MLILRERRGIGETLLTLPPVACSRGLCAVLDSCFCLLEPAAASFTTRGDRARWLAYLLYGGLGDFSASLNSVLLCSLARPVCFPACSFDFLAGMELLMVWSDVALFVLLFVLLSQA